MSSTSEGICVTTLTPTYSTLPRLNTTVLLLVVLFSPNKSWATKAALAALMTRVSTIVIHSFVLLATKNSSRPWDLDTIGSWFILSEVAASIPALLCWSPALHMSKARYLVKTWGVMVFAGAVCGFTTVRWAGRHTRSQTCMTVDNADGYHVQTSISRDNIFSPLTSRSILGKFDVAAVVAATFGLWTCIRPDSWSKYDAKRSSRRVIAVLELLCAVFSTTVLVASVVLHEKYMLQSPRLPMLLPLTAYEQWSCWAATGIILVATLANWALGGDKKPFNVAGNYSQRRYQNEIETDSRLEWSGILARPLPAYVS
ncbi:uncharacterized protein PV09_02178 [Verruconis gallopava]|uniref:Uncharacterized protein n=1 Tax=Verruconis gallopava TaxID=253628 RepID=A0A0D2AKE5_9PEZI|nr:uncharacterized protein PV09_02178 [Verruconis gallopava]KIW07328.1 hypothetical protein PV09_02178 [Verruconis gallopava]